MTEKRYYQKNYEEEYYIFDSNTISEDEFEERVEYEGYDVFADSLTGSEIIDLLNENDKLKKENEHLKIRFKEERDISMRLSKECDTLIIKKQELERKIKSMAKELCNCEEDYILEEEF